MSIVDIFYTHDGIDYQMPFDSRENYGWRNSQGYPCNSIRQLANTEKGYVDLFPGKYDLSRAEAEVDGAIPGIVPTLSSTSYAEQRLIVECGGMWIAAEERFKDVLLWDTLVPGTASAERILKVENNSGAGIHNLVITLANRAIITQAAFGEPFYSIYQKAGFNPVPAQDLAVTFAAGLQLLINGFGNDLLDAGEAIYSGGNGITAGSFYHFMPDSDYEGIVFQLDSSVTVASTATLNVYSNIWEMGLDGDFWLRNALTIGTLANTASIELHLRADPYTVVEAGMTHALLQFSADEGEFSVPLAGVVRAAKSDLLDSSLLLRCGAITSAMNDTLYSFGFSEAS